MNIVHCIFSFNTGGAETMLIDIINQQIKTDRVSLIIVNSSYEKSLIETIDRDVKVIFLNRRPGNRSLFAFLRLNLKLIKLRPDVVHVHNSSLAKIIFPWSNYGLFYTVHDLKISLKSLRFRKVHLIAISDAVRQDVLSQGLHDVVTIQNGINVAAIQTRMAKSLQGDDTLHIVQVARLEAQKKGQDILIDAIAILKKRGVEKIMVDFIGEGNSLAALQAQAQRLDVISHVRFLGYRDRSYVYRHLKEYDLMCHPARFEGFGLVIAEGMAAKVPVLVPNEGGPYEVIKRGELGTVFEMGDATDCADKIEWVYTNYMRALAKTDSAYRHVAEKLSVERMVKEYRGVYVGSLGK